MTETWVEFEVDLATFRAFLALAMTIFKGFQGEVAINLLVFVFFAALLLMTRPQEQNVRELFKLLFKYVIFQSSSSTHSKYIQHIMMYDVL